MIAVARLALTLASWHAAHAKHGLPARLDDARQCAGVAIRQLKLALGAAS